MCGPRDVSNQSKGKGITARKKTFGFPAAAAATFASGLASAPRKQGAPGGVASGPCRGPQPPPMSAPPGASAGSSPRPAPPRGPPLEPPSVPPPPLQSAPPPRGSVALEEPDRNQDPVHRDAEWLKRQGVMVGDIVRINIEAAVSRFELLGVRAHENVRRTLAAQGDRDSHNRVRAVP